MAISFWRYPGGKSKLSKIIVSKLNDLVAGEDLEYREPFFGGGSIGLTFLASNPGWRKVWINDKDKGVAALWTSVIRYPELLKDEIRDFTPEVKYFDEYKKLLLDPKAKIDNVLHGFMKLVIHQISYSGLGTKSGGPLGGRTQESKYKIDCRWSPDYICKKIDEIHDTFIDLKIRRRECTSLDFEDLVCKDGNAIIYLDPPYYVKGNDLYQEAFTAKDHERLARCLWKTKHKWVLSYDNCREVYDRYKWWANIELIDGVNYSITATKDKETGERKSRAKPELLISSK